jgi:hypothetical protein
LYFYFQGPKSFRTSSLIRGNKAKEFYLEIKTTTIIIPKSFQNVQSSRKAALRKKIENKDRNED